MWTHSVDRFVQQSVVMHTRGRNKTDWEQVWRDCVLAEVPFSLKQIKQRTFYLRWAAKHTDGQRYKCGCGRGFRNKQAFTMHKVRLSKEDRMSKSAGVGRVVQAEPKMVEFAQRVAEMANENVRLGQSNKVLQNAVAHVGAEMEKLINRLEQIRVMCADL
jgi:hypothetical protein